MTRRRRRGLKVLLVAFPILLASLSAPYLRPVHVAVAATSYYIDCNGGNDGNSGQQPSQAWRSLARANQATLYPGDDLLLRRGCAWTGPLNARWSGMSEAPITIESYGSGALPTIQNAHDNIVVTGSYLIFDSLATRADAPAHDLGCDNNPMGWRVGFRFTSGSSNDIVRNSIASNQFYGIDVEQGSSHNQFLNNQLVNNNMKSDTLSADSGGVGIVLGGDDNRVAFNYITGSDICSRFYGRDGTGVEVYGGKNNTVDHNTSIDNNNFTELGNARTANNTFAYNYVRAYQTQANFLVVHGTQDSDGPTYNTRVYNNSVYLSGSQSYAIQCAQGCGPDVLTFENNIVWAEDRIGYADAAFTEGNNIYWRSDGRPPVWFPTGATSQIANPQYVDVSRGDLHLQLTSPARARGNWDAVNLDFATDLDGNTVPQGNGPTIGAYEFASSAPSLSGGNTLTNPSFDNSGAAWLWPWSLLIPSGGAAWISPDSSMTEDGGTSARITINKSSGALWSVQVQQRGISLNSGRSYLLSFYAKSSASRTIQAAIQQGGAPYALYALRTLNLSTDWQQFTVPVQMNTSDPDAAVNFNLAGPPGQVWLDNVSLIPSNPTP